MWSPWFYVVALVIIAMTHWIYKWKNPTCKGRLPPGSMGLPLIGESSQFFVPGKSLDILPFVKERTKKYGPLFKTSLAGRPVVVSSDSNFNHFIFQQEEKLVELWYMDSFAKLIGQTGSGNTSGYIHKYIRKIILNHIGPEVLKEKTIPKLEDLANQTLHAWSTSQTSIEVKQAVSTMIFNYTIKELFGYDPEKFKESIGDMLTSIPQAFMSFPLNIPGTSFHKCLKDQQKLLKILTEIIEERQASRETRRGDFLDQIIDDMKTENFLTNKSIAYMMFGIILANFETISSTMTLAIKSLTEHPLVVQELAKEHEELLCKRGNMETGMKWKEYKSLNFTMQVINESIRMASVAPAILRRAIKDIHINGYTIPEGWTILIVPSAIHLNPDIYKDPLAFNPWRWKEMGTNVAAKHFIPFGGGMRSCAGAEFSKLVMTLFLHVLVTKYRWTKVKGGEQIVRAPILSFIDGYHIKVSKKLKLSEHQF